MKKQTKIKIQEKYENLARVGINLGIKSEFLKTINRKIHSIFSKSNKQYKKDKVKIGNNILYLDKIDYADLSFNSNYEGIEYKLIKDNIGLGDVVIDIGANIGFFTLLFAELVGHYGKVYAFEPDPTNFALLKKNVQVNRYDNVILINKAVGDFNGSVNLFLSKKDMGNHKIYNNGEIRESIKTECVRLDDYFKNIEINFIKIDVEGSEMGVIKGGENLLLRSKLKMMTEFYPELMKDFGNSGKEYLDELKELGFSIKDIQGKKEYINKTTEEDFLSRVNENTGYPTNLFCEK